MGTKGGQLIPAMRSSMKVVSVCANGARSSWAFAAPVLDVFTSTVSKIFEKSTYQGLFVITDNIVLKECLCSTRYIDASAAYLFELPPIPRLLLSFMSLGFQFDVCVRQRLPSKIKKFVDQYERSTT